MDQLRAIFRQPEVRWNVEGGTGTEWRRELEARYALQALDPLWDELFPAEEARIVALLVERVDIGKDGNVRLRVHGLGGRAREMLAGKTWEAA